MPRVTLHLFILSLSLLLASCQPPAHSVREAEQIQAEKASLSSESTPFQSTGEVRLLGNTLTVAMQLPPLPQPDFTTQRLDLASASKIMATVKDSYGKTYLPVGADGNGRINYPGSGVLSLTFNNVLPDELLLVELKVLDTTLADIPQADLAVALRHTGTSNPAPVSINFQTGAIAKTLKALLASNAARARVVDLAQLTTLMTAITGQGGTAPNFTYSQVHPTLVKTADLATDLVASNPNALMASNYRFAGTTVNLNVTGLIGSDKLQVQVTDAASVVKSNLGNGTNQTILNATPGSNLKVHVSAFGTPSVAYTYSATPSTLTLTEAATQNVAITATPNISVTGFSPAFGAAGTSVVITGTGFSGSPTVSFNGTAATNVTVNSATQLTATVPATATDGTISVTNGATATSADPFNVHRLIYVKHNATGSNNGTSWANAYTSLKTALDNTGSNDELWVAAGTYKPHASDVDVAFEPYDSDNIKIYGGFFGNESTLAARNVTSNATILSGDLGNNDNTTVTPFTSATPNTNIVFRLVDKTNITLDGFTIQGAEQLGLFVSLTSNAQLRNLTIQHNKGSVGAGIQITNNSSFTADNLTVSRNFCTQRGAGLSTLATTGTITHSLFEYNQSGGGGGGGLSLERDSALILTNSQFNNNSANTNGGAIVVLNGNSGTFSNGNITISNVIFKDNSAANGSGIRIDSLKGAFDLNRSAFMGHTNGEVISVNLYNAQQITTRVSISNVLIANNTLSGDRNISIDGELAAYATGVALRNVTLANNTCTGGSDSRCRISNTYTSRSTYQNVLFWKDQIGPPPATVGGNVDLGTGGTPFISSLDPDGADNQMFTADDGFMLSASATLAHNMGITGPDIPTTDIRNQNRVLDPEPGAYEYTP